MSKVFHRDVGVFDPHDLNWEGDQPVDDDGREFPKELVHLLGSCAHSVRSARFEVWKDTGADEELCVVCGGRQFFVGGHDWETYVKCAACGTERCVHSG
jgi:hypothetical protein